MNWYKRIKLAQIWKVENDGSFSDWIKAIYELEYKLQALNNFKFKGNPERKENITNNVEKELGQFIKVVKEPLLQTFATWLDNHALLDPSQWATARVYEGGDSAIDMYGEESAFDNAIAEYSRYKLKGGVKQEQVFSEMINEAINMEGQFPSLQKIKEWYQLGEKERLEQDLSTEGYENFGNIYGQDFASNEQAQQYIEQMVENFDLGDYLFFDEGIENFINTLENVGIDIENFLIELYQNLVFPLWFNYWQDQGIEETRNLVQNAYDKLSQNGDINYNIAAINHALNTTHQTGDMIEYIGQYAPEVDAYNIEKMLDSLSSNEFLPKWNKELRSIGVVIPRSVSQRSQYELV